MYSDAVSEKLLDHEGSPAPSLSLAEFAESGDSLGGQEGHGQGAPGPGGEKW